MAENSDLLIGDEERATATAELREHYEAGRLTLPEFEGRVDTIHAARTEADLREAFRQLPSKSLPSLSPRDTRWRSLVLQYALVNAIAILIWVFGGSDGDFWPKWVFLVTLVMFARRVFGGPERHHRRRHAIEPPPPPRLPPTPRE